MNLARKVTLILMVSFLIIAPISSMAAEEGSAEVTSVTEHNEICLDAGSTSYSTLGFAESTYTLEEVNSSIELDFDAEILNVTQNGSSSDLSNFSFDWEYFQHTDERNTTSGTVVEAHGLDLPNQASEVSVFWSLEVTANNGQAIESICLDGAFTLLVEVVEEEHSTDEPGNFPLALLLTMVIPTIVILAFNRITS